MHPQSSDNDHPHPELERLIAHFEEVLLGDFRNGVAGLTLEIRRLTQVPA